MTITPWTSVRDYFLEASTRTTAVPTEAGRRWSTSSSLNAADTTGLQRSAHMITYLLLEFNISTLIRKKQNLRFKREPRGAGCSRPVDAGFWSSIKETLDCPSQFSTAIKHSQMKTIKVESSTIKQTVIRSSLRTRLLPTRSQFSNSAHCKNIKTFAFNLHSLHWAHCGPCLTQTHTNWTQTHLNTITRTK